MQRHKCGCGRSDCNNNCSPCGGSKKKKPCTPACCPATAIPDSLFTDFLAAIDSCADQQGDPTFASFFAPDVLGIIALFLGDVTVCEPASQFYGLDEVLANRALFCANTLSRRHTLTNLQRFTFGPCDLTVVLSTDIVLEFAPGFGITGTQEIKTKFNENCKISTYVVNTVGTFGPIGTPTPGLAAARSARPADPDGRIARALRALGGRK